MRYKLLKKDGTFLSPDQCDKLFASVDNEDVLDKAEVAGKASYYNSVEPYAGQANVQGWIGSGKRIVNEHVGRVVSKARNDNSMVQISPNQYIVPNNDEATQANINRILQQQTNAVLQFMEQTMIQGQRELVPKMTIVIGDSANGEFYKYTGM